MQDFKIRRGPSALLFSEPGIINPKLVIEEGCWYLCTDTAELFLGISINGELSLKQINEVDLPDYDTVVNELKKELETIRSTNLYIKITDESDLPTDFDSESFNPNITYYVILENNKINTFIFDISSQSYLCTSGVDEAVLRDLILETVDFTLVDELLSTKLPEAVKQIMETVIIHGGNALG